MSYKFCLLMLMIVSGVNTMFGCEQPGEKTESKKRTASSPLLLEQAEKRAKTNEQAELDEKLAQVNQQIAQLSSILNKVMFDNNQLRESISKGTNPLIDVRQISKNHNFNQQKKYKTITHNHFITSVKFSKDNRLILIGDVRGGISIWNIEGPNPVKMLKQQPNELWGFTVFGSDDNSALIGLPNKACYLNFDSHKEVVLKGYKHERYSPFQSAQAMAISSDRSHALTRSNDFTANYWSLKTGELLKILRGHTDTVIAVAFATADGKLGLTASLDGTICLWDLAQKEKEIKPSKIFNSAAIGLMPAIQALIKERKLKSDHEKYFAIKSMTGVNCLAISSDSKYVLTGSEDGTACFWDLNTGDIIKLLCNDFPVQSVSLLPDGKHALTGGYGKISLWDLSSTLPKSDPILTFNNRGISSFEVSSDGQLLEANGGMVSWLEVSSDGKLLAAACEKPDEVRLYDLEQMIKIAHS